MKKGFTLIELLAVIVILAILALIVSPIISGVISDAKKAAAERSMEGYIKSVELAQVKYQGQNRGNIATDVKTLSVEYSNDSQVTDSHIVFENTGIVATGNAYIGNYYCEYEKGKGASCNTIKKIVEADDDNNEGIEFTLVPKECFDYVTNGDGNITITKYKCGDDFSFEYDSYGNLRGSFIVDVADAILDVRIPSKIDDKTVTVIGDGAFKAGDGAGVSSVKVPSSVTTIDDNAFNGNGLLQHVVFGTNSNLTSIGDNSFAHTAITTINLPSKLTTIGSYAFSNCRLLSTSIPNSVTSIGAYAFANSSLTSLTFAENSKVTELIDHVFSGTNLTSITIPRSVKTIKNKVFYENYDLTEVIFEKNSQLELIDDNSFHLMNLENITIPASVKKIGDSSFYFCSSLKSINFEAGSVLEEIGETAFLSAGEFGDGISNVVLPNSLITIGERAFDSAKIKNVTLSSSLKTIGNDAFANNKVLTGITIPKNVESIGGFAFYEDAKFDTITFESGSKLKTIGTQAFRKTSIKSITVPDSVTSIASGAFEDTDLTSIHLPRNPEYTYLSNCLVQNTGLTSITIPASITDIGQSTFENNDYLTEIIFENADNLLTIDNYAFSNTKINSFTVPKNVTSIGARAFYWGPDYIVNKTGRSFDWAKICGTTLVGNTYQTSCSVTEA